MSSSRYITKIRTLKFVLSFTCFTDDLSSVISTYQPSVLIIIQANDSIGRLRPSSRRRLGRNIRYGAYITIILSNVQMTMFELVKSIIDGLKNQADLVIYLRYLQKLQKESKLYNINRSTFRANIERRYIDRHYSRYILATIKRFRVSGIDKIIKTQGLNVLGKYITDKLAQSGSLYKSLKRPLTKLAIRSRKKRK